MNANLIYGNSSRVHFIYQVVLEVARTLFGNVFVLCLDTTREPFMTLTGKIVQILLKPCYVNSSFQQAFASIFMSDFIVIVEDSWSSTLIC